MIKPQVPYRAGVSKISKYPPNRQTRSFSWLGPVFLSWLQVTVCGAQAPSESMQEAHYPVADGPKWERIAPPEFRPGESEAITLAFSPEFIFLGTRPQGLFRYARKNHEWTLLDTKLPSAVDYGFNPASLKISPHSSTTLYAGIEGHGVYRSRDSGLSWTHLNTGLKGGAANVICFAFHPADPQQIFAGTDDGIYLTENAGGSWSKVRNGLPKDYQGGGKPSIVDLCCLPAQAEVLFCAILDTSSDEESGIYRSQNGGLSWRPCNRGILRDPKKLQGDPDAHPVPNVPVDTMSGRCVVSTPDGNTLFCGTGGGLYRTADRGDHWIRCGETAGLVGSVAAIAIDQSKPNVLFASSEARVFGSVDAGNTWRCVSNGLRVGLENGAKGVAIALQHEGKTYNVTVYRRIDTNIVECLAFDPYAPGNLYAGCSGGLFRLKVD